MAVNSISFSGMAGMRMILILCDCRHAVARNARYNLQLKALGTTVASLS
jgi:hypothetical protein